MRTPCQDEPELWVSDVAESRREAAKECARCPLFDACREESLNVWPEHGVWAGVDWSRYDAVKGKPRTIPRKRDGGRKRVHGTYGGYRAHRRRDEYPCDPCTRANARYQAERRVAAKEKAA